MDILVFGSINLITFLLFIIGLICLTVEIFTPGLGVPAGIAFICFTIGIIIQSKTITEAIIMIAALCGIYALIVFLFVRSAKKGRISKSQIILKNTVEDDLPDRSSLLGKEGISHTALRPSGSVIIEGTKYDAVSGGDFIEKGEKIIVVKTTELTLTVEKKQ